MVRVPDEVDDCPVGLSTYAKRRCSMVMAMAVVTKSLLIFILTKDDLIT